MNDCIEWPMARNSKGYGVAWLDGKQQYAHRVTWTNHFGPIPAGGCVLHHCDNPPCVNIDHLFLGTARDNAHDAMRKGRFPANPTEHQTSKTHCKHGHLFSVDNTYVTRQGWRQCRICQAAGSRKWKAKTRVLA